MGGWNCGTGQSIDEAGEPTHGSCYTTGRITGASSLTTKGNGVVVKTTSNETAGMLCDQNANRLCDDSVA